MTRVSPRTSFHSSALIRFLTDLAIVDAQETGSAFAEKLGAWIHFTDAITLSAIHSDCTVVKNAPVDSQSALHVVTSKEYERVKAELVKSVKSSCSHDSGTKHNAIPEPLPILPLHSTDTYTSYYRFYVAHQRNIELRVQPLRVSIRDALAKASPELKKLADLDRTFETILRDRESKLLSAIPVHLKKHFERLLKSYQQSQVETRHTDNSSGSTQLEPWLTSFCNDMQTLLLAEIELRLQPIIGLMEALNQKEMQ